MNESLQEIKSKSFTVECEDLKHSTKKLFRKADRLIDVHPFALWYLGL